MRLAHNPTQRAGLAARILAMNYKLFEDDGAVAEWDRFLAAAVANATIATGTSPAPPAPPATPGERELPAA